MRFSVIKPIQAFNFVSIKITMIAIFCFYNNITKTIKYKLIRYSSIRPQFSVGTLQTRGR